MSNWFKYLIKTPIVQIRKDVNEYKELERACQNWVQLTFAAKSSLVRTYDCDENLFLGSSCIKRQVMFYDTNEDGIDVPVYKYSHCEKFAPRDDEQLCEMRGCACWNLNKIYCANKDKYNNAQKQKAEFWKNKFENVR